MKNKALSVVLCFATLFSVLACCLMGTASAKTYANYQDEVLLTFDGDHPYGIPYKRSYVGNIYTDKGYLQLENMDGSGSSVFFGNSGDVGRTPQDGYNNNDEDWKAEHESKALEQLYMFQPSETYRISYKYRLVKAETTEAVMKFTWSANPAIHGANDGFSTAQSLVFKQADNSANIDEIAWQTVSYTFKALSISSAQFACGFKFSGTLTVQVDDVKIEKLTATVSCGTTTGKLHTMTGESVGAEGTTNSQYDVWPTSGEFKHFSSVEIVKDDEQHGDVLKIEGNGANPRVSLNDFTVQKGHKYYITYEAKADTETKLTTVMCTSGNSGGRFIISNDARTAVKYYVEGIETQLNDFKATTAWKSYGIYIDLNDNELIKAINSDGACTNCLETNVVKTICFGAANTTGYFDNMQIFDVTDMELTLGGDITDKSATSYYSLRKASGGAAEYTSAGIRFKGYIPTETAEAASEIGFVVTPSALAATNENWYKIDNTDAITAKYDKDAYYDKSGDNTGYQVLITGLSTADGKTAYEMPFAAALYTKNTDGNYTYYYIGQASYNEILGCYTVTGKDIPTK